MATRNELINEMLKKMFEYASITPPYDDLRSTKDKWQSVYSMPQDAKIKWLNWGAGFLKQRFGVDGERAKDEMEMMDTMYGLKTY